MLISKMLFSLSGQGQVKEICCGAEIDPKQVRQNHLIVSTCEYTMQKNCVCLQILLHWVLS